MKATPYCFHLGEMKKSYPQKNMCANISQRPQIELRLFIEDGGTSYSGWPMKLSDAALTIVIFSQTDGCPTPWFHWPPTVRSAAVFDEDPWLLRIWLLHFPTMKAYWCRFHTSIFLLFTYWFYSPLFKMDERHTSQMELRETEKYSLACDVQTCWLFDFGHLAWRQLGHPDWRSWDAAFWLALVRAGCRHSNEKRPIIRGLEASAWSCAGTTDSLQLISPGQSYFHFYQTQFSLCEWVLGFQFWPRHLRTQCSAKIWTSKGLT